MLRRQGVDRSEGSGASYTHGRRPLPARLVGAAVSLVEYREEAGRRVGDLGAATATTGGRTSERPRLGHPPAAALARSVPAPRRHGSGEAVAPRPWRRAHLPLGRRRPPPPPRSPVLRRVEVEALLPRWIARPGSQQRLGGQSQVGEDLFHRARLDDGRHHPQLGRALRAAERRRRRSGAAARPTRRVTTPRTAFRRGCGARGRERFLVQPAGVRP